MIYDQNPETKEEKLNSEQPFDFDLQCISENTPSSTFLH